MYLSRSLGVQKSGLWRAGPQDEVHFGSAHLQCTSDLEEENCDTYITLKKKNLCSEFSADTVQ